jgi:hypothetical protein
VPRLGPRPVRPRSHAGSAADRFAFLGCGVAPSRLLHRKISVGSTARIRSASTPRRRSSRKSIKDRRPPLTRRRVWREGSTVRHTPIRHQSGRSDISSDRDRTSLDSCSSTSKVSPESPQIQWIISDSRESRSPRTDTQTDRPAGHPGGIRFTAQPLTALQKTSILRRKVASDAYKAQRYRWRGRTSLCHSATAAGCRHHRGITPTAVFHWVRRKPRYRPLRTPGD